MKGILSTAAVYAAGIESATAAAGSDKFLTEIDCGNAQNGTLVIVANVASSSSLDNVEVWTSAVSDFGTSGTQLSAVASDGIAQVAITSDADNLWSEKTGGDSLSTKLSVSSNKISSISEDSVVVINCKNISRYLKIQYDSDGVGSSVSQVFIGHDTEEGPWSGARSAY